MDGFLLLDKEKGMTSFSLCNKIKYKFSLSKTGHSGTLDPNATGLMIVALDKATKLLKLLNYDTKEYIADIVFGLDSKSYDIDSEITNDISMPIDINNLKEKMEILKKKTTQLPPMVSAIKVNGKKLMRYKDDEEVLVQERDVHVIEDELIEFIDSPTHPIARIRLKVSKGFYIRSYAHDLGILLGGCAIVKELRRTKVEDLSISDAKSLDDVKEYDIIPINKFFNFQVLEVDKYRAHLAQNGVTFDKRQTTMKGIFIVRCESKDIAIYEETEENIYKPLLIF
jgi:tRNA pseudouridine55 synthase